ncbi:MAG: peptidoglycan editing factor PgeF [Clostridia bacterium]|nr:peptidoglycan editing factor PgeF [Clostridia bacterium]
MFVTHRAENGVVYVTSDILKSKHAFSTRIGGVSQAEHTSEFNLAFNRGDCEETVKENLRLFGAAVGFAPESVVSLPQIHSANIIDVNVSMCGEGYFKEPHISCDGYVTSECGAVVGVKTADCVPILLEAHNANMEIVAVSAVHAGWRGTLAGIARKAVLNLLDKGVGLSEIKAAIGPSIGSCCFEVGSEVVETVSKNWGEKYTDMFVVVKQNGFYIDLKGVNRQIIADCGVPLENIDVSTECTFCLGEKYYSHRRMKGVRGTMLSVIAKD